MDDRERNLEPAHAKTFDWLLESTSPLAKWLETDEPLFWITGKPGSGKSTLLRTLFRDNRMHTIIEQHFERKKRTGPRKFLFAIDYFFDRGTDLLQKPREGLMRAILHQFISQANELGPILFGPSRIENEFWQPGHDMHWRGLKKAFDTLSERKPKDVQLILFVDGLDEYRSLDRFDNYDYYDEDDSTRAKMIADGHDEIGELFKTASQFPNMNPCVSSRPLLRFKDIFEIFPHIKLHDLTREDISLYVQDRLGSNEGLARLSRLEPGLSVDLVKDIKDIVNQASGVFLWVKLVVDILIRGLTDRDRIQELRSKVREIPDHLDWPPSSFRYKPNLQTSLQSSPAVTRILLDFGADPNEYHDDHRCSVWHASFFYGRTLVIRNPSTGSLGLLEARIKWLENAKLLVVAGADITTLIHLRRHPTLLETRLQLSVLSVTLLYF